MRTVYARDGVKQQIIIDFLPQNRFSSIRQNLAGLEEFDQTHNISYTVSKLNLITITFLFDFKLFRKCL